MRASQRLIIEATYASWAAQDLATVGACLHKDAVYLLHLPPGAWPISGAVRGKATIIKSLAEILRDFEVVEYRPLKIAEADGLWTSRARIHYGHRAPAFPTRRRSAMSGGSRATRSGTSRYSTTLRGCARSSRW
jgi:hypothetical protein